MKKATLVIALLFCVCLLLCGCGTQEKKEKLLAFAEEQFMENNYEGFLSRMRKKTGWEDLEVVPIITYGKDSYNKKTNTLHTMCSFTFKSDVLDKYYTTKWKSDNAYKLASMLKLFQEAFEEEEWYLKYSGEEGKVIIQYKFWPCVITSSKGRTYSFDNRSTSSYYSLKVDGEEVLYEKRDSTASSSNSSSSYSGSYDATLSYGSDPVLIFISEDAMERYMTAMVNGYQGTMDEMKLNGEVASTERNTKCNIITEKLTRTKVKLLDGSYAGNTVWVINESVQKKG